jgi:signal transduction histidine kinase
MPDFLRHVFQSDGFMPHGHCYLWRPGLVWLHVVSDFLIGLAYVAISATLANLVSRIRNIPFNWMFLAFGLFIVACGGTHFMEVWTLWTPTYWLAGDLKALTALASVAVAVLLPPLVPRAVRLAEDAGLAEERRRELEQAHVQLATLYDKVKELDGLKTQFFANVSHELRTPLALVLGPTEKLLAGNDLSAGQRQDLEVVNRNARALLRHVNDLLDLSKLEAGKMEAYYAEVDLARLVRQTAAHFESVAHERNVLLEVDAPEGLPAEIDPDKVQRVLLNLLSNAFKFVPGGGTVRCGLVTETGQARFTVEDTGPGVPPALREAIFERFRQVDGSDTRSAGGTGLGLSIAKEFVELHGGTIAVDDAPSGGARFTVDLPLAAPAGVEVRRATSEPAPTTQLLARQALEELRSRVEATAISGEGEQPLALVVEDNPEMNRFISETLAADYRIASASDGQEGYELALVLRPDVIVTDVMMPRASGDHMLRELRKSAELDGVPVVVLTAKADDELRVRLLQEGAQDYVMKPFSAEELRARVANLVTIKRAREVLQRELASQVRDLGVLASEVTFRKRELRTALDAMRVARDHAERASRAKSDFLSLVSHELCTPLTTMRTYLHVLERDKGSALTPEHRAIVAKIGRSSTRLVGLIDSLLEYARIESGRLAAEPAPVDLPLLLRDVIDEVETQAEEKGLTLRGAVVGDLPPLVSDARLLRLILVNLIGNGIKYTERGGVNVSVSHAEGSFRLAVEDSGPGIPIADQDRIFEPFEQLEPVRNKHTPGVGLGLALVKQMVGALGGHLELCSEPDRGSTFTLVLPPGAVVDLPGARDRDAARGRPASAS